MVLVLLAGDGFAKLWLVEPFVQPTSLNNRAKAFIPDALRDVIFQRLVVLELDDFGDVAQALRERKVVFLGHHIGSRMVGRADFIVSIQT
jgi:hypothetical protein